MTPRGASLSSAGNDLLRDVSGQFYQIQHQAFFCKRDDKFALSTARPQQQYKKTSIFSIDTSNEDVVTRKTTANSVMSVVSSASVLAVQMQTAETAHLKSKQLLLFAFG